jgi:hypothetical protein
MATTTNYGWTTPDDTALVKDGAAAIRTLGSSVDTTTKNLNPSTTLGDIEYRSSSANTNTRLGIGSTGQVLTVAGGVPSWVSASSGAMTLVKRASFSNVAGTSTTFDDVFTSTYKSYNIQIENLYATTSDDDLHFQLRYAGPTTETTGYYGNTLLTSHNSATITNSQMNNASQYFLNESIGISGEPTGGNIFAYGVGVSGTPVFSATVYNVTPARGGAGQCANVTSRTYTGFLLKSSSSNITGTVAVYGLA